MSIKSFFAETFWVPNNNDFNQALEEQNEFELILNNEVQHLKIGQGKLILNNQYLNLLQTVIELDERGVTLVNQFGEVTINGNDLQKFYDLIQKQCIHQHIENYYLIGKVSLEVSRCKIIDAIDKKSGMMKSIRKYSKELTKGEMLKIISLGYEFIYEDSHFLYIIGPTMTGHSIKDLPFEKCFFGLLKLLYRYHTQHLKLCKFDINNVVQLDNNYNFDVLDHQDVQTMSQNILSEINSDIIMIQDFLLEQYPQEKQTIQSIFKEDILSSQELLYSQIFINYFGESEFYRLLNTQHTSQKFSSTKSTKLTLIDTFNTIRQSMFDSESDIEDDDDMCGQIKSLNFDSQQFDDSPMLSPKIIPNHKPKMSSRQVILETLLQENLINQQQFQHFYKEEEFEDEEEINQFSKMLTKEIESSSLTTPIQSENTTCPNTVLIHSQKNVNNRISDILQEARTELLYNSKKAYNANKVYNVRKNLFNMMN